MWEQASGYGWMDGIDEEIDITKHTLDSPLAHKQSMSFTHSFFTSPLLTVSPIGTILLNVSTGRPSDSSREWIWLCPHPQALITS